MPHGAVLSQAAISKNEASQRTEILHDTIETNYSPAIRVGQCNINTILPPEVLHAYLQAYSGVAPITFTNRTGRRRFDRAQGHAGA